MTSRIQENTAKVIFLLILFVVLMLQTLLGQAQSLLDQSQNTYKGFVVSFGTHTAALASNIEKIDQSRLLQAGGQVGLTFGNDILRSRIGLLGYYSSTEMAAGTTDLYTSNAAINFYPLACISSNSFLAEPYLTGSLNYDQYKFYGYYLNQEPGELNYSQASAPYLGKIKQVNATIGLGLEVKLHDDLDFIHIFSEVWYGYNISTKANNDTFSRTGIRNQMAITAGVAFGMHR